MGGKRFTPATSTVSNSMNQKSFAIAFAAVFVLLTSTVCAMPAAPASPQLTLIMPRGVQRGHEHVLTFHGRRLEDAQEVFFYDKGITVKTIKQVNANQVKVTVIVAKDCRVGEHFAQLRTRSGISDYRNFFVGVLPAVAEVEPNSDFAKPQKVSLNHTIAGVVTSEDVDHYAVEARKGQRLSVEIEGIRAAGAFWDPFIAILNKDRFEIASSDDTPLLKQDGHLSVIVPEDGTYTILVRDSSYQGNGACRYRLHVGNFPRPTMAFPAGGPAGTEMDIKFLGDPTGVLTRKFKVPSQPSFRQGIHYEDNNGMTPSPVAFRISNLKNAFEIEPNNQRNQPSPAKFPCALNGIIGQPGDRDYFKVSGKKGQVWDIECFARRIRSGLDPVINIYNGRGQRIAGNDDARGQDSYLRYTLPADGDYLVQIRDHLRRGQADFVYRIEIKPPRRSLSVSIPRVDRYSQRRQTIVVPQGGRFASLVSARRSGFGGQLVLDDNEMPQGITAKAEPMAANLNLMPVVFSAAADAPLSGKLVDFKLRHIDAKQNIRGGFFNVADLVLGPPNNSRFYGGNVNRLAFAVVDKLPFRLELVQPTAPLVRNGRKNLKIKVHRDSNFKGAVTLQFPFRPPGVGTRNTVVVPANATEASYPINANGSAQLGKWPIYVLGSANVKGNAWVSTQLAYLEITQPIVTVTLKRTSTERGKPTQIYCKLNKISDFAGEATAQLYGTPAGVVVTPQKFTKDTKELTFPVTTTNKSPIGKHKSVFCQVVIQKNGEPVVSTAGVVEFQITRPPVKKKVVAKPPAKKPAAEKAKMPPKEKPLSRLEQLRKNRNKKDKKP